MVGRSDVTAPLLGGGNDADADDGGRRSCRTVENGVAGGRSPFTGGSGASGSDFDTELPPSVVVGGFDNVKDYFDERAATRQAARFIEDAFFGVKRVHPLDDRESQRWYVTHLRKYYLVSAVAWGFVMLTFFERPMWCIRHEKETGSDPCRDPNYPTFGVPFLPRWWDLLLEIFFIAMLALQLYVERLAFGKKFFDCKLNQAFGWLLVLAVVDLVYAYATPWWWFRLAPYIRISILAVRQKDIHGQLEVIRRILPSFGSICLLFALFVLLFAWCGCIVFAGDKLQMEKEIFFPTIWDSIWTLMILITTNNSPNVILPAYTVNRLSVIYYVGFMSLAFFFGLNMITAIVYKEYNSGVERDAKQRMDRRKEALREAFGWLDRQGAGKIDSKKVMEVFWEMNSNTEIEYIAEDRARLLFAAADTDGDNMLDLTEFLSICDVLQVRFHEVKDQQPAELRFPELWRKPWFRRFCNFVNSQLFESIIDLLLILNAALIAVESSEAMGWNELYKKIKNLSIWMEQIFSLLFVIEVVVKVYVKGWGPYWKKFGNKFDFLVTVATVLASIYVYYPNQYNNNSLIRWLQVLRILRAVRFLARMNGFKAICGTFVKMLGPASRLIKIMFVVMFVFSALGMQIFGGRLNWDPNSPYSSMIRKNAPDFALPDSLDPAKNRYDFLALNFNDLWSGYVVLFVLLVVNNWDIMTDGFIGVTTPWLRLFFVIFHFIGVFLCLNIATSFIIDTALENYGQEEKPEDVDDGMTEVVGDEAIFEAEAVNGNQTGLKGKYRAVLSKNLTIDQDRHAVMNRLFSSRSRSMRSFSRFGEEESSVEDPSGRSERDAVQTDNDTETQQATVDNSVGRLRSDVERIGDDTEHASLPPLPSHMNNHD